MAQHGGARPGSGRPKGSLSTKSKEIADRLMAEGITPLEVMLAVMRQLYVDCDSKEAASVAKDAAPYMHPRLATVEHSGQDGGPIKLEIAWQEGGE